MTTLFLSVVLLAHVATADLQQPALQRGIAAETAARWDDALVVYLDSLMKDPTQPELWLRVADIQARLGQDGEALRAIEQAAAMEPSSAAIQYRLSQAYAAAGQAPLALQAIERALVLSPGAIEYLKAHATLATWAGKYGRAQESYRRLCVLLPSETTLPLDLARVSAWAGSTDEAARAYRKYLQAHPEAGPVWLELAKTESWRGNFPGAAEVLETYRQRFGESPEYSRELAGTLARGGRPREATRLIARLLPGAGDDDQLQLSQAIALAAQQRRSEALSAFEAVRRRQPDQPETRGAERFVRAAVASTAEPRGDAYHDSDGLRVQRFTPRINLSLMNGTRIEGAYERTDLRARAGSGLEQVTGTLTARQDAGWLGLTQRLGTVSVVARGGYASLQAKDMFTYGLGVQLRASDTLRVSVSRDSGFLVVSPRTVGLGLTRIAHGAQLDWTPSLNYTIAIDGSIEDLSDGNRRWDVLIAPRRIVARTERLNLDLGVQVRQFHATENVSHGYYDPHRYESYAVTAFPYWKISENTGFAVSLAVGAQRDDAWPSFRLGGNAAAEATFGIFEQWMLRVNGALTLNERTESGAFRAYGGAVVLVRRF
jgi:tetratricopeptide (TPR) repeat protein